MNSSKKIVTIGLVIVSAYYLYLCAPYFYGHFNYSRDFACFGYMAPNILRHASGSELYNLQTQRLFYPQQADLFMSYNHPPFEALIFIPLSFLPFAWAFIAWNLCNAAFLAVIGKKLSVLYGAAEKASILFFPRILWLLSAFFPVWFTLLNGQDSILFLLLLVLSLHSAYAQKFFQAGLLLGIAIFKPHLCLPLAAGMGARWKRPFLLGFILSAGFWTLLSVGLIGKNGVDQALSLLSLISKEHALFGIHYSQMANLRGALERVFPALGFDRMAAISLGAWLAGGGGHCLRQ